MSIESDALEFAHDLAAHRRRIAKLKRELDESYQSGAVEDYHLNRAVEDIQAGKELRELDDYALSAIADRAGYILQDRNQPEYLQAIPF